MSRWPPRRLKIRSLAEKVWISSRRESRVARTVVLKLKTREFEILTRSHTPAVPPQSPEELVVIAFDLRGRVGLGTERKFRLVGVALSNFTEAESPGSSLFD